MLTVNGHDSHNFLELINAAIKNKVHSRELPAHTSHWLQLCDRTVLGPFKNVYRKACEDLGSFPGSVVSKAKFAASFLQDFSEAMSPQAVTTNNACEILEYSVQW